MRRILVTTALPYMNGPVHVGHLLEHIQTDIWTRYQRLIGNECHLVSGNDAHGTTTMLAAEQEGITPEELIERVHIEHETDFRKFGCNYDEFCITHSEKNKRYSELIYGRLVDAGCIFVEEVEQLYDTERGMFLADRYVRGTCPSCGAEDQAGDNCDICGATYPATSLGNPRSVMSDSIPILRKSDHVFVDLAQFEDYLRSWTNSGTLHVNVANKLKEWLDVGLKPWDISRDEPYFGFEVPGQQGKYFYVWMDAPIGYIAGFENWCEKTGLNFDDFWVKDNTTELHHFIGKDIVNFHALFWPAVLSSSEFRTPTKIHVHGFVTVGGTKMSKSKGTFVNASIFAEHFDPEILRYYYASRLSANPVDIDVNFNDMVARANSDLVGKFVNIASRCSSFLARSFDSMLVDELSDTTLLDEFLEKRDEIANHYEEGSFARAIREVMGLADRANQYLAQKAPWTLIKEPDRQREVHEICSLAINLFRILLIYLKPVVPELAKRSEKYLNVEQLQWTDLTTPLLNHKLNKFERLMNRADDKSVRPMIEAGLRSPTKDEVTAENEAEQAEHITIDDFFKVSLRAAKVVDAQHVEGSKKLLRLQLDVGDHSREVLSGIRDAYEPEDLVGKFVVVVANLAPRKMRFGVSEGMVLAAGDDDSGVFLISPDAGVEPGMTIS